MSYGIGKGVLVGFPEAAFHRRIVFVVIDDTVASDFSKNRAFVFAKECNPGSPFESETQNMRSGFRMLLDDLFLSLSLVSFLGME